jgi:hypothetical protein
VSRIVEEGGAGARLLERLPHFEEIANNRDNVLPAIHALAAKLRVELRPLLVEWAEVARFTQVVTRKAGDSAQVGLDLLTFAGKPFEVLFAQPDPVAEFIGEHAQLGPEKPCLLVKNPIQAVHREGGIMFHPAATPARFIKAPAIRFGGTASEAFERKLY